MKLKIAVLFGGESVEHEISIISAHQAIEALDKNKYDIIPIYVAKNRQFYYGDALFNMDSFKNLEDVKKKTTQVTFIKDEQTVKIIPVKATMFGKKELNTVDIFIPVMHGTNGEDGTIQGYLEMLKVPYAGCDVMAAAVGQDKVLMKNILQNQGIPMTPWFWCYGTDFENDQKAIIEKANKLGYPLVLKPACLGSSVGIVIAHNEAEFIAGIEETSQYDFKVVVEKMVPSLVEINCSVLGSSFECKPSVLEQVAKHDEILSYVDKYQGNGKGSKTKGSSKGMASTSRIVPAPISDEQTSTIKDLAVKTFKYLGASGVCRIDFMMNGDTKEIFVNEINTIPGSLSYYLWEPEGLSFTQLMDKLVEQALDRTRRRDKMIFSYDTNILENFSSSGAKGSKK